MGLPAISVVFTGDSQFVFETRSISLQSSLLSPPNANYVAKESEKLRGSQLLHPLRM
jgi:hypothetical protein